MGSTRPSHHVEVTTLREGPLIKLANILLHLSHLEHQTSWRQRFYTFYIDVFILFSQGSNVKRGIILQRLQ
jgi:hypothetical protein